MSKVKVAIIEDDSVISQMYRMKLEMEGFDVQVAGDGVAGIELAKNFAPDIILLDVRMPRMNGDQALAEIRKYPWGKDIPVVVLTNTGRDEFLNAFNPLDIVDFIVKAESTPKDVVALIEKTVGKK
jgi:CheY-like chemotaxis protein